MKGHLRWVFRDAQRPHRFWHRSYVINGMPKDGPTFQLDQQCYPFLEICDFYDEFSDVDGAAFVKEMLASGAAEDVLGLIASKRDASTGLFPTDETPGDDAVAYPYHFSSHVLLWYTLARLASMLRKLSLNSDTMSADTIQALADGIRDAALKHFVITESDGLNPQVATPCLAYLVDGTGQRTVYHDANDIPTVYAGRWGFLETDLQMEAWKNTMKLSLHPDTNPLGYSSDTDAAFSGLGSVHSPGPWPLGYFQELLFSHILSQDPDTKEEGHLLRASAAKRIVGGMQWDGTFGEALDVHGGQTTSKAWFSWPGSMIASALIEEAGLLLDF